MRPSPRAPPIQRFPSRSWNRALIPPSPRSTFSSENEMPFPLMRSSPRVVPTHIIEERWQFDPTKVFAISAIQARVGADPQLVTTDRQQTIDLSVGQSCVDLGSSTAPKKKEAIAECAHPNLVVGCFCQRDYWR